MELGTPLPLQTVPGTSLAGIPETRNSNIDSPSPPKNARFRHSVRLRWQSQNQPGELGPFRPSVKENRLADGRCGI